MTAARCTSLWTWYADEDHVHSCVYADDGPHDHWCFCGAVLRTTVRIRHG
jgi:hypothetical protein